MADIELIVQADDLGMCHAVNEGIGLHCTLTCEWDHLRWRPITGGDSLVGGDGTMHCTA